MKSIHSLSLMAMALMAAASGAAHAQHVVGGMGEEVRIGAFSDQAHGNRNRGLSDSRAFNAAKRDKGRTRSTERHDARPGSVRAPASSLPGRHLP